MIERSLFEKFQEAQTQGAGQRFLINCLYASFRLAQFLGLKDVRDDQDRSVAPKITQKIYEEAILGFISKQKRKYPN